MAQRSTNTMAEMLQSMLQDISVAKTLPDADLEFLVNLETTLLGKIREPLDQAGVAGGAGGMAGPSAPPAPAPAMGSTPTPGTGVNGVMSSPEMPNPDELRRLMNAG